MRHTPMRRGALSEQQSERRAEIAAALETHGLSTALARRIAFQLVTKFRDDEVAEPVVWRAAARILTTEVARLRRHLGLAERQIVRLVPKLSARQAEEFFTELSAADRRIARTIFDAALDAARPLVTGRRYLAEYRRVAEQLAPIDPSIARTLANACFTASAPRRTAMAHLRRFANLLTQFDGDATVVRMVAKTACRARDPMRAAEDMIAGYHAVLTGLTARGIELTVARRLAASMRLSPGDER